MPNHGITSTASRKRLALLLPDMGGGGAERVALRLMEDFLEAGHEVDLVLVRADGELLPLVPRDVNLIDLGASRLRWAMWPLRRYFVERDPHAIQISMWPLTVAGIIAHKFARSKSRLIISDHNALSKQYGTWPIASRMLKATTRRFYPLADARVMVSDGAADDLAKLSGLDRATIEVIYNPVSKPPPSISSTPEIEAMWGTVENRILTVGTLKEQKNHHLLIKAFQRLLHRRRAKLMILGEGPLRAQLEALATSAGVRDHVLLPGFTSDPWPYYASADLFVLSSDYEGYPLVLVEALRAGLTIVSTDCPSGPREILDGGKYGALVRVGDEVDLAQAMEQALETPLDKELLRIRAEEISGQSTSDRYLQLMLGGWEPEPLRPDSMEAEGGA